MLLKHIFFSFSFKWQMVKTEGVMIPILIFPNSLFQIVLEKECAEFIFALNIEIKRMSKVLFCPVL